MILFVESLDRGLRFLVGTHFDESESFATACFSILNDLGTLNCAEWRKQLF